MHVALSIKVLLMAQRNGEPVTCAPRRCVTLLFRRLLEASANTEHVFTWLNTNGHTRTALLMYIVHHNENL